VEFVDRPATAVDLGAGDGERNRAETRIQALLEAAGAEPA